MSGAFDSHARKIPPSAAARAADVPRGMLVPHLMDQRAAAQPRALPALRDRNRSSRDGGLSRRPAPLVSVALPLRRGPRCRPAPGGKTGGAVNRRLPVCSINSGGSGAVVGVSGALKRSSSDNTLFPSPPPPHPSPAPPLPQRPQGPPRPGRRTSATAAAPPAAWAAAATCASARSARPATSPPR